MEGAGDIARHGSVADLGRPLSIFDNIDRTTSGAASRISSAFNYLNTSNRIEAARARALVDDLFQRYPAKHQEDLKRRLRSVDNTMHASAFFELILHELLLLCGCRIVDVEPEVPESNRRPDFLVKAPKGERFYVESP